jgi:hypothetical protein
LEDPRRRWEDGIRIDLKVIGWSSVEFGWASVEWIQLARDRGRWRAVVNAVMNLRVLTPQSLPLCFNHMSHLP